MNKWKLKGKTMCTECENLKDCLHGEITDMDVFQNVESKEYFTHMGDGYGCYSMEKVEKETP